MIRFTVLLTFASLAVPGLALASPADLATIESECGPQLKMSPAACACIKGKASALNDGQQAFVAAVVTKNKSAQKDIMQNMTVAEMTEAGTFMTTAPAECGKGGG
jgi:hypothetical protein